MEQNFVHLHVHTEFSLSDGLISIPALMEKVTANKMFAVAITDSLERSIAADLLPSHLRGTGYGFLAMINGFGDFASSVTVGFLWSRASPAIGFGYSAVLCIGAAIVLFVSTTKK